MKKTMKKISVLLMALVMVLSMAVPAFAADSVVTYHGENEGFSFAPGSGYTETDLFDGFKDVMPGDVLEEIITVKNDARDCDYIQVYLQAVVHDENGNPLTYSEDFEEADGKDQEPVTEDRDETVATMQDFLKQLTMRIYNGEELIYNSTPDQAGALADCVWLGNLSRGEFLSLKVELDVPITMGNTYANRVGEVDWRFVVQAYEEPQGGSDDDDDDDTEKLTVKKVWKDNENSERPESIKVVLKNGKKTVDTVTLSEKNNWKYTWDDLDEDGDWSVWEKDVPKGYEDRYKTKGSVVTITNVAYHATGQMNWPIPVLGGLGILLIAVGAVMLRKKKA